MQLGMQLGLYWNSRLCLFGELDAVSHTLRLTPRWIIPHIDSNSTAVYTQDMCVVACVKSYTLIFNHPNIISALD